MAKKKNTPVVAAAGSPPPPPAAPAVGSPPPPPAAAPAVAPVAAPPPVEKTKQPEANGVTKPAPGTMTGKVWDIADQITAAQGRPATRKEVVDQAVAESTNKSTATTQFGKWAKFHGHVADKAPGRPPGAPAVAPAVAPAAGAAPAAAPASTTLPGAPAAATTGVESTGSPADFDAGYDAYNKGDQDGSTNPHAAGTAQHEAWKTGWDKALADAQAYWAAQAAAQPPAAQ